MDSELCRSPTPPGVIELYDEAPHGRAGSMASSASYPNGDGKSSGLHPPEGGLRKGSYKVAAWTFEDGKAADDTSTTCSGPWSRASTPFDGASSAYGGRMSPTPDPIVEEDHAPCVLAEQKTESPATARRAGSRRSREGSVDGAAGGDLVGQRRTSDYGGCYRDAARCIKAKQQLVLQERGPAPWRRNRKKLGEVPLDVGRDAWSLEFTTNAREPVVGIAGVHQSAHGEKVRTLTRKYLHETPRSNQAQALAAKLDKLTGNFLRCRTNREDAEPKFVGLSDIDQKTLEDRTSNNRAVPSLFSGQRWAAKQLLKMKLPKSARY
eukprot:TRINITY_DN3066_c0_g1_i3.p1 TRINITY_DN3066_c0_g1~~TRINITY_DN3066_c0_g1_i3.p1  ORF type:complete len:322 (+),score=49.16 TRINITY_DN3066_c0_g1_i3:64-1029(+)